MGRVMFGGCIRAGSHGDGLREVWMDGLSDGLREGWMDGLSEGGIGWGRSDGWMG